MPLAVCATPIGNLEDVTLRVLRELAEADVVLAEDTRHTRGLLERHGIRARLLSYHEHNEAKRTAELLPRLQAGERLALVSDAGLPGISDPGARLVAATLEAGVPVTVLRAAVVVGHGGISWELTRQLVHRLPVMIAPRWVNTRTQPIALPDVIRYLVGVLGVPQARGAVYEVGGPDVLRYVDMMRRASYLMKGRDLRLVGVPFLTPHLSSLWLAFVTDVDRATARTLIDSMTSEVVVHDTSIRDVVPGETMGYDDAVRLALADRARSQAGTRRHGPPPAARTEGRPEAAGPRDAGR